MTRDDIMLELKAMGNERTKSTFLKHGAKEPFFGVRTGDLKKIVKRVKKNHLLSLELYETGNSDAMYLAGLIADEKQISKENLQNWVENASWSMISEYTVPWIAAESRFGWELGLKWIKYDQENIASSGWSTLSNVISIKSNVELDMDTISTLLEKVENTIHQSKNRVRYTMNNFVIAVGSYIPELLEKSKKVAQSIGKVNVNLGDTYCKVPYAPDYINKIEKMNRIGKKRKQARC